MENKKLTGSILGLLLIKIGIMVLLLLIVGYVSLRLDFSKGKVYSLAKVSKEAVNNLNDRLIIKIYASDELPPNLTSLDRYLRDLLSEYKLRSKGKLIYQYVKAASGEELRSLAHQNNLQYMVFQSFENDQITQKEIIYGITLEYQGRKEAMTLPPEMESKLEYAITNKIRRVTAARLPELVVFRDSTYSYYPTDLMEMGLDENYLLASTDLRTPPRRSPVMLFTGTIDSLSQDQLYHLDQYIMQGGRVVMLQDRSVSSERTAFNTESNLFEVLAHYGIGIGTDLVLDFNCDQRRWGDSMMPYTFYPVLRGSDDNIITRNISNIVMYLASEITTLDSLSLKYTPILRTSSNSSKLPGPVFNVESVLYNRPTYEMYSHPPIVVGALFEGKVSSFFADNPQYNSRPGFVRDNLDAKIVVYGDRELFMDPDNQAYADKSFVVLNAIDYLQNNESLIKVRSRSIQTSYLDVRDYMERKNMLWGDPVKTEKNIKLTVRIISMLVPPALMLGMIFIYLYLQKKKRKDKLV